MRSSVQDLQMLEKELDINFKNKELLQQALTHSSFVAKPRSLRNEDNGQLATLGDAVLGLVVAKHLYSDSRGARVFQTSAKGDLTILRSNLVSNERLEQLAKKAHLDLYLRISPGQRKNGGITPSMLYTAYEAIIGAIFLSYDYETAARFVRKAVMEPKLLELDLTVGDYPTK